MTMILDPSTSMPPKTLVSDFIVIGGGLTGLTHAYALARSGHRVTVLEKGDFDNSNAGGACRMTPNMSKAFFRWDLEDRLRKIAMKTTTINSYRFETPEFLGKQVWGEDYLTETGGDFIFASYANLRDFVYQLATELGVTVRPNAKVTSIDTETNSVILASGERLSADIFIGADGADGISRQAILGGTLDQGRSLGYVVYDCIIPYEAVVEDPGLLQLYDEACLDMLLGNGHSAVAFPLGAQSGIGLYVYAPDRGITSKPTLTEFQEDAKGIQGRLRGCLNSATRIKRRPVEERPELKYWVHDTCPLLLVGNAAHSMPAASFHNSPVATEDAAALGKLFSHLSRPDQIRPFLYAFQDLRQTRVTKIKLYELENVRQLTLEDSEYQKMRDGEMKANAAKGLNMFGTDDTAGEIWENNRVTFDYDGEEAADNWWMQWGVLRERAKELAKEAEVEP